jgi:hypothetical protein
MRAVSYHVKRIWGRLLYRANLRPDDIRVGAPWVDAI